MEYWWLVLGKPPAYSSARLGHIPSLPWESQLPLKPCLTLQSFNFEGNCDSSDSLLDFCCVSLCSSDLLRKRGLLAHTSAAFLKNCCTEKLFVYLRLIIGNNALRNSIHNFPALLLMTILRHCFLNLSVYNQFRCFSCLLKRLLHGFLIALRKLPQNPIC